MTTVYLAGKMGRRVPACDCGVEGCHNHCEPEHAHKCGSTYQEANWRTDVLSQTPEMGHRVKFMGGYTFGGPWYVDQSNHDSDAEHVARVCFGWLAASNVVFAWITSMDAHGTFAELGYAKARGIPIFVAFDRDEIDQDDERELWFIRQMADGTCSVRGVNWAFAIFTHWLLSRRSEVARVFGASR